MYSLIILALFQLLIQIDEFSKTIKALIFAFKSLAKEKFT